MGPPVSHRVSRVPWYSGSQFASKACFMYRTFTFCGGVFQPASITCLNRFVLVHTPHRCTPMGLGSSPFARRYLGNRFFFLLLRVLRCFSSPGIPSSTYGLSTRYLEISLSGLPHSDTPGLMLACSYPRLIAAYRVLLRLLVPRHSPFALIILTWFF